MKVLKGVCIGAVIVSVALVLGVVGGLENDTITIAQSIPSLIGFGIIAGIGTLGLNYVEAKEEYLAKKNRRY